MRATNGPVIHLTMTLFVIATLALSSGVSAAPPTPEVQASWKTCMAKSMFEIIKDPACKATMTAMNLTPGDVAKLKACQSMSPEERAKDSHCMQLVATHPGALP